MGDRRGDRGHFQMLAAGFLELAAVPQSERAVDEAGVEARRQKCLVVQQPLEERNGGLDAPDFVLRERAAHAGDRVRPGVAPGDELRDQRVVEDRHLAAFVRAAVVAHARSVRHAQPGDASGRRQEAAVRILRVDAALDGVPARREQRLGIEREPLAARDPDLPGDQIDAGDHLGHRMFDLQPRVHLEEVERAGRVHQELDRAGVGVVDGAGDRGRRFGDGAARLLRHRHRGTLLDDFLVAPLQRTLALDERQHRAVLVAEQLHLDVTRLQDPPLEIHGGIAEGRPGLGARRTQRARQFLARGHRAHALASTAGNRLQHQRIADRIGDPQHLFVRHAVVQRLFGTGHDRHAGADRRLASGGLAAHHGDRFRRRADEDEPGIAAGGGEVFVLGEEAVARMHGIRARPASPRRRCGRCADSSRAAGWGRLARLRRPSGRAAPPDRIPNRQPRWRSPCRDTRE